jgi:hypothetical protein
MSRPGVMSALPTGLPSKKERRLLLGALGAAIRQEGVERFLEGPILLPDEALIPQPWTPDADGVERLAKKLLPYTGLERFSVVVTSDLTDLAESKLDPPFTCHRNQCVWLSIIGDDVLVFGTVCSSLEDVAGALAHVRAHAVAEIRNPRSHAQSPYRVPPKEPSLPTQDDFIEPRRELIQERLALSISITLGFGIFELNHSWTLPLNGKPTPRAGYLAHEAAAFLLAFQLTVRNATPLFLRRIRKGLCWEQDHSLRMALEYFEPQRDTLLDSIGIVRP